MWTELIVIIILILLIIYGSLVIACYFKNKKWTANILECGLFKK